MANCDPTALSKNPGEEGLLAAGCLGAALVGVEGLDANCEPTALSKKPPPEEAGLEEPGLEEPLEVPATYRDIKGSLCAIGCNNTNAATFASIARQGLDCRSLLVPANQIVMQLMCISVMHSRSRLLA